MALPLKTPDVTPVQWKTTVGSLAAVLEVLFGLDLTDAQQGAIVAVIIAAWTLAQTIGDAITRFGRSRIAAAQVAAEAAPQAPAFVPPNA